MDFGQLILGYLKGALLIIEVIFLFGILVIAHEYGHFIAAKLSGMRVDEFAVGFGKKLLSWTRGETEYTIRAVPLGGFNRIYGMDVEEDEERIKREQEEAKAKTSEETAVTKGGIKGADVVAPDYSLAPKDDPRAFVNRPIHQRIAVVIAGPIANIIAAVVIVFLMGIAIGFPAAELGGVIPGGPAAGQGLMAGDVITHLNGVRLSSTADLHRTVAFSRGEALQLAGLRGREHFEVSVIPQAVRLVDTFFCRVGFVYLSDGTVIYNYPGSPSERAGIDRGDIILSVDDLRFPSHRLQIESGNGILKLEVYRGYKQETLFIDYFESELVRDSYSPFGYFFDDTGLISTVIPNGIADEGGLLAGDLITGGETATWTQTIEDEPAQAPKVTTIEYLRDGQTRRARLDPDPTYARIQVYMDDAAYPILVGLPYDHRLVHAGMQSGDEIVSIEGVPTPNGITAFLEFEHQIGNTVTVIALSNSEERAFVVPIPSGSNFEELQEFFAGLHFKTRYLPADLKSSFMAGIGKTVDIATFIFMTIGMLVTGEASLNELAGPVGIATITYEAASSGLVDLINIMVLLSVNLAIFNLLPFPALDGGRLVFMVAEAIFRRPVVTVRIENFIHIAGFLLLLLFAMFITYQDVLRIIFGR